MDNLFLKIGGALSDPRRAALCIVTASSGSVPGKAGAKMVVYGDGTIEGTVGGGGIERIVIDDALTCIRSGSPVFREYDLGRDLGMTCGGLVSVYIEPLARPARLFIFGAGHIGKTLARYAAELEFDTTLIDWRTDLLEPEIGAPYAKVCRPYLEAAADIPYGPDCYVVIVTPNHTMDEEVLAAVGKKEAAYIGLIGSKRKIATLTKLFLDQNTLTQEELDRVNMPIGIPFNAVTPAEIAISILAKLIDVRNSAMQVMCSEERDSPPVC